MALKSWMARRSRKHLGKMLRNGNLFNWRNIAFSLTDRVDQFLSERNDLLS